jgi:hypothetical protein
MTVYVVVAVILVAGCAVPFVLSQFHEEDSMRITTRKVAASFVTLTLTLGVVSFFTLVIAHRSPAQVYPPWPNTLQNVDFICILNGLGCATCPGNVGCTSPIPAAWSAGTCNRAVGALCNGSTFPCGPQYVCATGNPNGVNCPTPTICQ